MERSGWRFAKLQEEANEILGSSFVEAPRRQEDFWDNKLECE
jgi:hypothetical protein